MKFLRLYRKSPWGLVLIAVYLILAALLLTLMPPPDHDAVKTDTFTVRFSEAGTPLTLQFTGEHAACAQRAFQARLTAQPGEVHVIAVDARFIDMRHVTDVTVLHAPVHAPRRCAVPSGRPVTP
ncbi:hypothetical protein CBQ26_12145 [Deinococcus indicus]|uniref:Uncharacterized protein n=1 Tax=Deinococcus indicus TaxID=223556 RepID=A0A246BJL1_9DEIO|nr:MULTISPECIES: hypothetical protein [Deinococcus]MCD0168168.1 hypothetical protein [Deinococcus sp. 23YEL01]OWL95503.1 hypothetical protein CBQ26_12145 [Deinococcus indicus]